MRLSLEEWRELANPFYDVFPRRPAKEAGVEISAEQTNGLLLTQVTAPVQLLVHDPSTRKGVNHDYLLFERFYAGGGAGEVAEVGFRARPSCLHLIDMSQRYVSLKGDSVSRGVLIPHVLVDYQRGRDPSFASVEVASPAGRLLATAHKVLSSETFEQNDQDRSDIALAFLDLVRRFMLRRPGPPQGVQDDRRTGRLLREYVKANLDRHDLSPEHLLGTFGISRAALYRYFQDEGGVTRYIRNRRLDRCFFELAGLPAERGRVSRVAKRWRFGDAPHFNRVFKERYGMAPSDCLLRPKETRAEPDESLTRLSQAWFRQLDRA